MWKTIKYWWVNHLPFITTKKKEDVLINCRLESQERIINYSTNAALNPVIHSLEELKKNTWDIERVERMQEWLKDNFSLKNNC